MKEFFEEIARKQYDPEIPEKIEAIREWDRTRAVPASGRPIGEDKLSQRQGPKTRKVLLSNN